MYIRQYAAVNLATEPSGDGGNASPPGKLSILMAIYQKLLLCLFFFYPF